VRGSRGKRCVQSTSKRPHNSTSSNKLDRSKQNREAARSMATTMAVRLYSYVAGCSDPLFYEGRSPWFYSCTLLTPRRLRRRRSCCLHAAVMHHPTAGRGTAGPHAASHACKTRGLHPRTSCCCREPPAHAMRAAAALALLTLHRASAQVDHNCQAQLLAIENQLNTICCSNKANCHAGLPQKCNVACAQVSGGGGPSRPSVFCCYRCRPAHHRDARSSPMLYIPRILPSLLHHTWPHVHCLRLSDGPPSCACLPHCRSGPPSQVSAPHLSTATSRLSPPSPADVLPRAPAAPAGVARLPATSPTSRRRLLLCNTYRSP
jgi:hypothetical protein